MLVRQASINARTGSEVNPAPLVSVIMPAYNVASFIGEALDSVFAQTYRNFEVIVVNDGSPDSNVLECVLKSYLERIVYIEQVNRGAAGARNTGIRHARGGFLAFLDSDDSWTPEYLASQMGALENNPSLDVVYSDAFYYSDSQSPGKRFMDACPSQGPVTLESLVLEQCHVCVSCTVARKQTIFDAGLFDEDLPRCDDFDMWLRVAYQGRQISYHRRPLGWVRPGRPGSLGESERKTHEADLQILSKLEKYPAMRPSALAAIAKGIALQRARIDLEDTKLNLSMGAFQQARSSLIKANTFFQSPKLQLIILGLRLAPRRTAVGGRIWNYVRSIRERHARQAPQHSQVNPLTAR
jgi:hypothetical protein